MGTTLRQLSVGIVLNAKPFQHGLKQTAGSLKSLIAPVLGFTSGMALFHQALEADKLQSEAVANLEASLRSTGNAAGFTSKQLQKMAADLQAVTTFGDEATIQAQAVLATFTQIKGDNFRLAAIAAQDMATKLRGDLQSSIIQVGKALNDPIKGVGALGEVGVSFTQDQKNLIKSLVETNRVAAAQKIILNELATEFGGSAAAQARTLSGQVQQLKNSFGDLLENGIVLIKPALMEAIHAGKEFVSFFQGIKPGTISSNLFNFSFGAVSTLNTLGKLRAAGAPTAASIETISTEMKSLNAAQEKAVQSQQKFLASLQEQKATFGMSARQLDIFRQGAEGASQATLKLARSLDAELTMMESLQREAEEFHQQHQSMLENGKQLAESLRNPIEAYAASLDNLQAMLRNGAISWDTFHKAVAKTRAELVATADISAPKSPQAFEQGSAGAFQAIAESRGAQKMAQMQEQMLKKADKQIELQQKLVEQGGRAEHNETVIVNF